MTTTIEPAVAFGALAPIDLPSLDRAVALRTRVDRKYVVSHDALGVFAERLSEDFRVLEIDGQRTFTYRNLYFDSPQLDSYRAHLQQRRRRFKVRVREYVETGVRMVEVKLKGGRGQTIKRRRDLAGADEPSLAHIVTEYLAEILYAEYGVALDGSVVPTLEIDYRRSALASMGAGQRVTVDSHLTYVNDHGATAALRPGWVIVETKSPSVAPGPADRILRSLGARPVSPLSKYLLGIALTTSARGSNEFRRTLSRYFKAVTPQGSHP